MSLNDLFFNDELRGILRDAMNPDSDFNKAKRGDKEKKEWLDRLYASDTEREKGKTAIELQKTADAGAYARQGLLNKGTKDVADINNQGNLNVAVEQAGMHRYMADRSKEAVVDASGMKADPRTQIVKAYAGNQAATPEGILGLNTALNAKREDYDINTPSTGTPQIALPTPSPSPVTSTKAPARMLLNNSVVPDRTFGGLAEWGKMGSGLKKAFTEANDFKDMSEEGKRKRRQALGL